MTTILDPRAFARFTRCSACGRLNRCTLDNPTGACVRVGCPVNQPNTGQHR